MGIDFSKPTSGDSKHPKLLNELVTFKLVHLREAYNFFTSSDMTKSYLTLQCFEEVFGQLIEDPESHFRIFEGFGHASDPMEVFSIFALFCNGTLKAKVEFMFMLFAEHEIDMIKAKGMFVMARKITRGLHRHFKCQSLDDSLIASVVNNLIESFLARSSAHREALEAAMAGHHEEGEADSIDYLISHKALKLPVTDFVNLCHDSRQVWDLLEAVNSICNTLLSESGHWRARSQYHILKELEDIEESERLKHVDSTAYVPVYDRPRHPLWSYYMMDAMDESWFSPLPCLSSEDSVFAALEHLVLSGRRGLPVFATSNMAGRSKTTHHARFSSDPATRKSLASSVSKSTDLIGIIDLSCIVAWIASCCPETVTSKVCQAEVKRREKMILYHQRKIQDSFYNVGPAHSSRKSSTVTSQDLSAAKTSSKLLEERLREVGTRPTQSQWQEVGDLIAASPVKTAMQHSLHSEVKLKFSADRILQSDQFFFDAVLQVAEGQKSIPISASMSEPSKNINQVITDVEVMAFIRQNATEMLGNLIKVPVANCGFLKKPATIALDSNYGSALYTLAVRGVDTAVIVDKRGRLFGRFCSSSVKDLWWNWKQQMMISSDCTLDELKASYEDGSYHVSQNSSGQVFSMFSCLLNPLIHCDSLGVKIVDFDVAVNNIRADEDSHSSDSSDSEKDGNYASGGEQEQSRRVKL